MEGLDRRIRLLRQEKGWTQAIAAQKLDMSVPAFSKIECGITDVNLSRLEQIAAIFKISLIELLTYGLNGSIASSKLADSLHRLKEREEEVARLQKKVLELFEELRLQSATEQRSLPLHKE